PTPPRSFRKFAKRSPRHPRTFPRRAEAPPRRNSFPHLPYRPSRSPPDMAPPNPTGRALSTPAITTAKETFPDEVSGGAHQGTKPVPYHSRTQEGCEHT